MISFCLFCPYPKVHQTISLSLSLSLSLSERPPALSLSRTGEINMYLNPKHVPHQTSGSHEPDKGGDKRGVDEDAHDCYHLGAQVRVHQGRDDN